MTKESHDSPKGFSKTNDGNTIVIPDKLYFKIGEVCELTGIKQHALRYWESEFTILRPQRASSKQRLYRRSDVENIFRIKNLLHEEGFTIAGAKKALARKSDKKVEMELKETAADKQSFYKEIKSELLALKDMLEK